MQEQQADIEISLQQKQLEVVQAANEFQPVIANLEKVRLNCCCLCAVAQQLVSHVHVLVMHAKYAVSFSFIADSCNQLPHIEPTTACVL